MVHLVLVMAHSIQPDLEISSLLFGTFMVMDWSSLIAIAFERWIVSIVILTFFYLLLINKLIVIRYRRWAYHDCRSVLWRRRSGWTSRGCSFCQPNITWNKWAEWTCVHLWVETNSNDEQSKWANIIQDPHFLGLAGQRYDVIGKSGEIYNLLTSPACTTSLISKSDFDQQKQDKEQPLNQMHKEHT